MLWYDSAYAYPISIASEHAVRVASVSCARWSRVKPWKVVRAWCGTSERALLFPVLRLFSRQSECVILVRARAANRPYAYHTWNEPDSTISLFFVIIAPAKQLITEHDSICEGYSRIANGQTAPTQTSAVSFACVSRYQYLTILHSYNDKVMDLYCCHASV